MGSVCCGPLDPEILVDENIKNQMNKDKIKNENVYKLLLLGAGESGKSTLLKQMRNIHGQGYKVEEFMEARPYIILNTIEAMRTLCIYSELLQNERGFETKCNPENEEIRSRVAMMEEKHPFTARECADFKVLWADPGIQRTHALRSQFQIIDTAPYLFERMDEYCKPDFLPVFADIVHSRKRTTGINRVQFVVRGTSGEQAEKYDVYDVGGQRNERKKWMYCFDNISAIIFVAALSAYDQLLWEDARVNRIHEALQLFDCIVNMECFADAHMILFLNKIDLFQEKIKHVPLNVCFQEYEGVEGDAASAIKFIESKFSSVRRDRRKIIYSHVTCATDTENIYRVFDSVRDIVVRKELGRAGLL